MLFWSWACFFLTNIPSVFLADRVQWRHALVRTSGSCVPECVVSVSDATDLTGYTYVRAFMIILAYLPVLSSRLGICLTYLKCALFGSSSMCHVYTMPNGGYLSLSSPNVRHSLFLYVLRLMMVNQ